MDNQNIKALISATLAFFGFVFLPWTGNSLQSAGSLVFANTLYQVVGAMQDHLIWMVLLTISVALVSSLVGIFKPDVGSKTSFFSLAAGLFAAGYFVNALLISASIARGLGFWVTLIGCLGLIIQAIPDRNPIEGSTSAKLLSLRIPVSSKYAPYLFLLPGVALFAFWVLYPMAYSFYMSLLRWDFISEPLFVGLDNYAALFRDPNFWLSIGNNIRWLGVFMVLPTSLGLLLAMLLNKRILGSNVFKTIFFLPYVLSYPVIGLVWAWMFNPSMGLVNQLLGAAGMTALPGWLADRNLAIWVIIIAASWRQVGYVMILYLAGLKSIDEQLLEAAKLDGANSWQLFWQVIFPLLNPITIIIIVISVIDSLRAFDLVSIMTRGGQDTQVLANMMYMETFTNYRMGYGAAIAVVLCLLTSVLIFSYVVTMRKREIES